MGPLRNSALSKQTAVSFLPQHTWGAMTQPPHTAPGIIPVLLAVLDPSLSWSRNMRGSCQRLLCCFWGTGSLSRVATVPHPCLVGPLATLAPLLRGSCTLEGCRGPPCPPWGLNRQEHIHCGSLPSVPEKSSQGIGGRASTPGDVLVPCPPQHIADSWAQITAGELLAPHPCTEAEPRCFLLSQVWS